MSAYDAILIPGGGVREGGEVPPWTKRRLDRAIERHQGAWVIALSAGTVHRPPPLDEAGFPIFESTAAVAYLVGRGLDRQMILTETCSYDTIGNAYFSRVIHAEPQRLKRLLVITSEFHMPRTREIFEWVYGLEGGQAGYALSFESVSDDGLDPALLGPRLEKERGSLQHVLDLKAALHTLQQLHRWLFSEHAAYAAHAQPRRHSGSILETY